MHFVQCRTRRACFELGWLAPEALGKKLARRGKEGRGDIKKCRLKGKSDAMRESSCYRAPFEGRCHLCAVLAVLLVTVAVAECGVIFGEPPSFTTDPEDAFVFEVDAAGNPVTLRLDCEAEGTPPPNITWYRSGEEDSTFVAANGSYIFPSITQQNTSYASGEGVEYYCTATNGFGTIRSRTVRAFYASFAGFEARESMVDVIMGQSVALECALTPGSVPTPAIEWRKCTMCDGSEDDEMVVEENTEQNTVRFLDGRRYLLLQVSADVISAQYFCRVTNKEEFQAERAPYTYTFMAVTSFPEEENGLKIYKSLGDISTPLLSGNDAPPVTFSVVAARENGVSYNWLLNEFDSFGDSRLDDRGPIAEVTPILLSNDPEDTSSLTVQAILTNPPLTTSTFSTTQTAYLLLQRPATITSAPSDMRDVLTGVEVTFTCEVAGTPAPTITWYHNGVQLESGDRVTISSDGGTVIISSTVVEDSGMYQCFAENDVEKVYSSWTLQVREPESPSISSQFSDNVVDCLDFPLIQQNDPPVVLQVNLTADPCPTVQWYINDTLITNETSNTEIIDPCEQYVLGDTEFSYRLNINALTEATTGFYTATFTNAGGEASVDRTFVTPYFRALILSLQSDPYRPIDDTSGCLLAGDTVKIVCANKAYPPATVQFSKDGSPVDLSTNRVNQTCDTLEIFGVEEGDGGSYTCTADNDDDVQASDTSLAVTLLYCIAPAITGDLTFSKNNPEEDEETTATCTWTGDPPPTVRWFKDGQLLVEAELPGHVRISPTSGSGSKLEILEVQLGDTGDYTCNVSNAAGFDFQVKRLEVREKESAVLSTTVIIGISAGGAGGIVVLAIVIVLLCCVWHCARRNSGGEYVVPGKGNNMPMTPMGQEAYNVDAPDAPEEEPEAFNPDYASLPSIRPPQPPQYKPTPNYPMEVPLDEMEKVPPTDDDFVGPYGQDNGGYHPGFPPTVDDFVSDDAQFV